jgi:hypothetical protein
VATYFLVRWFSTCARLPLPRFSLSDFLLVANGSFIAGGSPLGRIRRPVDVSSSPQRLIEANATARPLNNPAQVDLPSVVSTIDAGRPPNERLSPQGDITGGGAFPSARGLPGGGPPSAQPPCEIALFAMRIGGGGGPLSVLGPSQ